jgi:hypothetical protein
MTSNSNVSPTLDSLISEYEALLSIVRAQAENEKRLRERLDFAANEVRYNAFSPASSVLL